MFNNEYICMVPWCGIGERYCAECKRNAVSPHNAGKISEAFGIGKIPKAESPAEKKDKEKLETASAF